MLYLTYVLTDPYLVIGTVCCSSDEHFIEGHKHFTNRLKLGVSVETLGTSGIRPHRRRLQPAFRVILLADNPCGSHPNFIVSLPPFGEISVEP